MSSLIQIQTNDTVTMTLTLREPHYADE